MKLLVKYVDFYNDNYQGASGKIFEFETMIEIKEPVEDVWAEIHRQMALIVKGQRPFETSELGDYPTIQKVTLL